MPSTGRRSSLENGNVASLKHGQHLVTKPSHFNQLRQTVLIQVGCGRGPLGSYQPCRDNKDGGGANQSSGHAPAAL